MPLEFDVLLQKLERTRRHGAFKAAHPPDPGWNGLGGTLFDNPLRQEDTLADMRAITMDASDSFGCHSSPPSRPHGLSFALHSVLESSTPAAQIIDGRNRLYTHPLPSIGTKEDGSWACKDRVTEDKKPGGQHIQFVNIAPTAKGVQTPVSDGPNIPTPIQSTCKASPSSLHSITRMPDTESQTVTGRISDSVVSKKNASSGSNPQGRQTNGCQTQHTLIAEDQSSEDDYGDDFWNEAAIEEMNKLAAAASTSSSVPQPAQIISHSTQDCLVYRAPSVDTIQLPLYRPTAEQSPSPENPYRPTSRHASIPPSHAPSIQAQPGSKPMVGKNKLLRVSTMALDTAVERQLFNFDHFNDMQSAVFQAAYESEQNLVVSAPTGSGKTTVFELSFLRMLKEKSEYRTPLAIYMAPTKALCYERVQDWRNRLTVLDVQCTELTGDTDTSDIYKHLDQVDLIITTPEKWDSITRKSSMSKVIDRLRLMMIDEVHILHESRGATLEVVVSRMKARGDNVRFVAVSASVPNIDDVARWLGPSGYGSDNANPGTNASAIEKMPMARVFKFGEEYRPVPLKRVTYGYDSGNDFILGNKLDRELFPILIRHSDGMPILVFCPTRKSCHTTAEHLCKEYKAAIDAGRPLPWNPNKNKNIILKDSKVQLLAQFGIAVHHAGLDLLDRRTIEQAFKDSNIHLIVATSTLAVGVNLPAHLVVIKGTSAWQGSGFREYSDIDIQQMMGRAGRPQYDTSGTVVVMCERSKVAKYQDMLNSRMILESSLHEHLTELHIDINSEIGLKTIVSLKSAQAWLRNSFLYVRIQQNPRHYTSALVRDKAKTWTETLDHYVEIAIGNLETHEFVSCDQVDDPKLAILKEGLCPTNFGKIMSQNFISYDTMCKIVVDMKPESSLCDLLAILAGSIEFSSLRIRQGESTLLNKLRTSPEIRFHLPENVKTFADKVFIQLQVTFGSVSLEKFLPKSENSSPLQLQMAIYTSAPRIARAILLVASEKRYGLATRSALELVRTVQGKAWEDSPAIFRQIEKIGPKSIEVLGSNGLNTWNDLIKIEPGRLEMWLNRNSPFGYEVIERAKEFPRFQLEFDPMDVITGDRAYPILHLRVIVHYTGVLVHKYSKAVKGSRGRKTERDSTYTFTALFISSLDNRFIDLRKIEARKITEKTKEFLVEATLYHPEEAIIAIAGVEERSGLANTFEYTPRIPAMYFPKPEDLIEKPQLPEVEHPSTPAVTDQGNDKATEISAITGSPGIDIVDALSSEDELIDISHQHFKKRSFGARSAQGEQIRAAKRPRVSSNPPLHEIQQTMQEEPNPKPFSHHDEDDVESVNSMAEFEQYFGTPMTIIPRRLPASPNRSVWPQAELDDAHIITHPERERYIGNSAGHLQAGPSLKISLATRQLSLADGLSPPDHPVALEVPPFVLREQQSLAILPPPKETDPRLIDMRSSPASVTDDFDEWIANLLQSDRE